MGFGATLTVLTTGAEAPMLEMQKESIRERVNRCYGYAAIQKVRITQTASIGFAGGRAVFDQAPKNEAVQPDVPTEVTKWAGAVTDNGLRTALERLGANVISHSKR